LCLHFEKKYKRSGNLSRHRGQTPDTGQKDSFTGDLPETVVCVIAPEQATICLNISSHASKAARLAPLTATIPKKPSKSETAMFDKTDSGKIPQETRHLHFGVLRKTFGLRVEKRFTSTPDR